MSDLEQKAFKRLRNGAEMSKRYYDAPLLICYSGGKDSDVLIYLAIKSGIDFEVLHNHTTADAPETVYYIRRKFKELEQKGAKCTIEPPLYKGKRSSMWHLMVQKKFPPTRLIRYCCEVLKEHGGQRRMIATGVRWAESIRRKNTRGIYESIALKKEDKIILNNDNEESRDLIESCMRQNKMVVNPIVDWTDHDLWDYIRSEEILINPLYGCGFSRVGCIGCPMAQKKRYDEFKLYPKYEQLYRHAFDKIIERRKSDGMKTLWRDGEDLFRWWMEEDRNNLRLDEVYDDIWED